MQRDVISWIAQFPVAELPLNRRSPPGLSPPQRGEGISDPCLPPRPPLREKVGVSGQPDGQDFSPTEIFKRATAAPLRTKIAERDDVTVGFGPGSRPARAARPGSPAEPAARKTSRPKKGGAIAWRAARPPWRCGWALYSRRRCTQARAERARSPGGAPTVRRRPKQARSRKPLGFAGAFGRVASNLEAICSTSNIAGKVMKRIPGSAPKATMAEALPVC